MVTYVAMNVFGELLMEVLVWVNKEQLRILTHMKKLIKEGKRRINTRKDRDYLQDLLEIGISE